MKHICLFSGGAASAYVSIILSQEVCKEDIILLNHDTGAEHPDTKRFMKDISEYLKIPVTSADSKHNLWECIKKNRCLPSDRFPFCTRELKIKQAEKFYKTLNDEYTLYNGFGFDEWRRVQKSSSRGVRSLLFEKSLTGDDAKGALIKLGFRLPETYTHLKHNNCIPCFKGGKKHFKAVWEHYPCQFYKAVEMEEYLSEIHNKSVTVFKDKSLKELVSDWQFQKDNGFESFFDDDDNNIPCACWD